MNGATITVWWGNDDVEASIHLTPRNWSRVRAGKPLQIRGRSYYYDGERFQQDWSFGGGMDGALLVTYASTRRRDDVAVGFDGTLSDTNIKEDICG